MRRGKIIPHEVTADIQLGLQNLMWLYIKSNNDAKAASTLIFIKQVYFYNKFLTINFTNHAILGHWSGEDK